MTTRSALPPNVSLFSKSLGLVPNGRRIKNYPYLANNSFLQKFLFSSFLQTVNSYYVHKSWRWLDSNPGPLVSDATTLPIAPQPLP